MRLRVTAADAVWATYLDGDTTIHCGDGSVEFPVNVPPIRYTDNRVRHVKLTVLKWDTTTNRYLVVGGIILAVGIPGTRNLGPRDTADAVFDLDVVKSTSYFTVNRLRKESPTQQWHTGTPVPSPSVITVTNTSVYRVWAVDKPYAAIASTIIDDIHKRAMGSVFRRNAAHWGPDMDERGFIRQSELRVRCPRCSQHADWSPSTRISVT